MNVVFLKENTSILYYKMKYVNIKLIKFIYSDKATKFCEIFP